ncbi:ATP-binding protein [Paenibacillus sediminis]|uniref:histidine kinase n=1 Tax=Paenibacillus sediminis TaxID=664909 RepID=A0ABS4GZ32_9BACL|nr:ATP-binding protein [Paenibacillus sediminis]MBP1935514.1 signal transduction histidine kinase [Paenibacillus sediminis]
MSIHFLKIFFIPPICALIVISSLLLGREPNLVLLILFGCLFICSVILDQKCPRLKAIQFIFLGLFHYISQLNWCVILYYILAINLVDKKQKYRETIPIAVLLLVQYTAIRLTYVPLTCYNALVSVFDIITSFVVILLFHTMINIEAEKKRLSEKNDYLISHDPLTGLLNYDGYMKKLQMMLDQKIDFVLILLDIQNFKSLDRQNFGSGNETLINIAHELKKLFPKAYGISRYAGDRFALMLPPDIEHEIDDLFDLDVLGFEVTYSTTRFPQEAEVIQELISIAEDKIFQKRRQLWQKRQDDMLRYEKMNVVGELAAGMAHEIRNPLTTIKGFVQLSKKEAYNIEPWYEVIMSEITRVTELTAEFLQFSKPHASNMRVGSLAKCIERVISLTESEASSRGHKLTLDIERDSVIYMDRDKIVQVLINLIRNAFEAMETPGNVHVRVGQEENMAVIKIIDTGRGIPSSAISRIFNPFFTTKDEGTGLGLSLCQKIVQDHCGTISVNSKVGYGSTFVVRLPGMG